EYKKDIIVVANKIDKIKKSEQAKQLKIIQNAVGYHKIIPYSSEERVGIDDLLRELFQDG
ncbi:MAG: EutP/PduV family microcompartment system protein, partial [Patescibacteria group bacterium]